MARRLPSSSPAHQSPRRQPARASASASSASFPRSTRGRLELLFSSSPRSTSIKIDTCVAPSSALGGRGLRSKQSRTPPQNPTAIRVPNWRRRQRPPSNQPAKVDRDRSVGAAGAGGARLSTRVGHLPPPNPRLGKRCLFRSIAPCVPPWLRGVLVVCWRSARRLLLLYMLSDLIAAAVRVMRQRALVPWHASRPPHSHMHVTHPSIDRLTY